MSVKTPLYLDNRFYVSKCSCILTDTYSIHIGIIMSHVKQARRLAALKNRALKRIFGLKREEVTGDLQKLHNEVLHYFTSHQILFG